MSPTMHSAVATRLGQRANNEDAAHAGRRLLALADGMGGAVGGEVASVLAIEALASLDTGPTPGGRRTATTAAMQDALARANAAIAGAVEDDPTLNGMGTTATALLFGRRHAVLGHIGDSRAYRLRGTDLVRLTTDDSYVQSLVDEGRLAPADVRTHPQRALVTRVLQGSPAEPSIRRLRPRAGDRYLLCSDGLSDAIPDEDIADLLRSEPDPAGCADRLTEAALAAGGDDNVTVVLADLPPRGRWRVLSR